MNILTIENLSKSFGDKLLFNNMNLGIHSNDKIGLIGRNGKGKTTLLKILGDIEKQDSGSITKGNNINIEYLPQNIEFKKDLTVLEQVFSGSSENIQLVKEYEEEISKAVLDNDKIISLTEKMDKLNAWELESEAKTILNKLGITDYNKKIVELSGGQKRRVALATALINSSELLILDEPTNHLDNKTIEWLEEYLINRKGALLMVTHDRYFLNRVTNRIVEIDNGKLYSYDGNYEYFLEKKAERMEMELASERKRESLFRKELAWMRQGIKARGTRAKSRVERFEELRDNKLELDNENIEINIKGLRLGKKIIEIENISKSFNDKEIIKNFFYTFIKEDRIGVLGENGTGKTTLINMIAGKLEPDLGEISFGETAKIGYFSQEIEDMDGDIRAIEYIKEKAEFIEDGKGNKLTASQMMELFLFTGEEQWTPINKLSGGEKRRLNLLKVLMEGPNILILDEPTNDLDIDTLTVLEDYLEEFNGPIIVVSHDRYFMDKIVEKTFHIEDGNVIEYPGNYSYFKEIEDSRIKEDIKINETNMEKKEVINHRNKPSLKFSFKEQREWESIDGEILDLENKIEELNNSIEENTADYMKLEELLEEKKNVESELELKMNRWVELAELKEEIDNK